MLRRPGDAVPAARPRVARWWPAAAGAAAGAIGVVGVGRPSKWYDEAATTSAANRSLPQLWRMVHHVDAVHGLYYAGMHVWIRLAGTSAPAVRLPSVVLVAVACAGVAVLGSMLGGARLAVFAPAVFAVLPRVTWMAIEARSLAGTAAVAVWLTVLLLGADTARSHRRLRWAAYGALGALGCVLNIYLVLLLVAHGIALVLHHRAWRPLVPWAVAASAAGVVALPVVIRSVAEHGQLHLALLGPWALVAAVGVRQYFLGATPLVGDAIPAVTRAPAWLVASVLLAALCWGLALLVVVRVVRAGGRAGGRVGPAEAVRAAEAARPAGAADPVGDARPTRAGRPWHGAADVLSLVAPWILVPTVVLVGYSLVASPVYTPRYLAFSTPAAALLVGLGIAGLPGRWWRAAALVAIAALALPVFVSQRGPTAKNGCDWGEVAAVLTREARPGQDIYYGPWAERGHVTREFQTLRMADAYPVEFSRLHDITRTATAARAGALWARHEPLHRALPELRRTPVLWAVVRGSVRGPALRSPQFRLLERAGLRVRRVWRLPQTDVLEFTRVVR